MLWLLEGPRRIITGLLWLPLSLLKLLCVAAALAGLLWGAVFAYDGDHGTALLFGATFLGGSFGLCLLSAVHAAIRRGFR